MPSPISIHTVTGKSSSTITTIEGGVLSFGREPENGVVVASEAVSRQHGCLSSAGSQWIFWDLGSTNGSWVNGQRAPEGDIFLLRIGDVIQLADFAFRIADHDGSIPEYGVRGFGSETTLLVFEDHSFLKEISFSAIGDQFVVGGPESDLDLSLGLSETLAHLSIVQTGREVELSVSPLTTDVRINVDPAHGNLILKDRDKIYFREFIFILNKPDSSLASSSSPAQFATPEAAPNELHQVEAYDRYSLPKHLQSTDEDWQSEVSRRRTNSGRKFIFGGPDGQASVGSGSEIETAEDARFGRGLSALHQASLSTQHSERSLLQRVLTGIGVFAILALFAWALSNMLASS